MKINSTNEAAVAAPVSGPAGSGGAAAAASARAERNAPAGAAAQASDAGVSGTVTMSAAARSLGVASTSAGSGIDEAKVAAVKAAIAAGTFRVDSGAIADKLLTNAQEVLSRTRSRDA